MAFVGQHSRSEAIQYGHRLDRSIQSLFQDIHENLVFAYPANLRNLAKTTAIPGQAKNYNDLADMLEKRSAGKSESQINKEVDYSVTYQVFVHKWDSFFDELTNDIIPPVFNWDQLEAYDSEFKQFYVLYPIVAGGDKKPSLEPPKTEAEIQKEHPSKSLFESLFGQVPWTAILLIGGGYLIWTQRDSIKSALSSKKELPEKTSEPA